MKKLLLSIMAVLTFSVAATEFSVNRIFSSHMVLQRDCPIRVRGHGEPGTRVEVSLGGEMRNATIDKNGDWEIMFPPRAESRQPLTMTVQGSKKIVFTDILVGDIWVCSGQSNMEFPLRSARDAKAEIATAEYPDIRLFTVPQIPAYQERNEPAESAVWRKCKPQDAAWFSAVGYFFGRDLYSAIKVPIGLIDASWGGTGIESWLCPKLVDNDPDFAPIRERNQRSVIHLTPETEAAYEAELSRWSEAVKKNSSLPRPQAKWGKKQYHLGTLYFGMIHPLFGFPIKGVIWYQGEANAKRAFQYRKLLSLLINDWRKKWHCGDFPFLIVQLPNYSFHAKSPATKPVPGSWAELREAQQTVLKLPAVELAVTIDIGEADNVHPLNKQDVGRRLALVAENKVYGIPVVCSGPRFQSVKYTAHGAELTFNCPGNGLKPCSELKYFELAGNDRKFFSARARTEESKVIVTAPEMVPNPVAVRYAWLNNPEGCNFYNRENLPAMPFRTDDWPGVTEQYK